MAKKKKHRCAPVDQALHREAIRLRSMTDKQLVEGFHRAAEPGIAPSASLCPQEGRDADGTTGSPLAIQRLLDALAEGKCKGIKGGIAHRVAQFAVEMGLV